MVQKVLAASGETAEPPHIMSQAVTNVSDCRSLGVPTSADRPSLASWDERVPETTSGQEIREALVRTASLINSNTTDREVRSPDDRLEKKVASEKLEGGSTKESIVKTNGEIVKEIDRVLEDFDEMTGQGPISTGGNYLAGNRDNSLNGDANDDAGTTAKEYQEVQRGEDGRNVGNLVGVYQKIKDTISAGSLENRTTVSGSLDAGSTSRPSTDNGMAHLSSSSGHETDQCVTDTRDDLPSNSEGAIGYDENKEIADHQTGQSVHEKTLERSSTPCEETGSVSKVCSISSDTVADRGTFEPTVVENGSGLTAGYRKGQLAKQVIPAVDAESDSGVGQQAERFSGINDVVLTKLSDDVSSAQPVIATEAGSDAKQSSDFNIDESSIIDNELIVCDLALTPSSGEENSMVSPCFPFPPVPLPQTQQQLRTGQESSMLRDGQDSSVKGLISATIKPTVKVARSSSSDVNFPLSPVKILAKPPQLPVTPHCPRISTNPDSSLAGFGLTSTGLLLQDFLGGSLCGSSTSADEQGSVYCRGKNANNPGTKECPVPGNSERALDGSITKRENTRENLVQPVTGPASGRDLLVKSESDSPLRKSEKSALRKNAVTRKDSHGVGEHDAVEVGSYTSPPPESNPKVKKKRRGRKRARKPGQNGSSTQRSDRAANGARMNPDLQGPFHRTTLENSNELSNHISSQQLSMPKVTADRMNKEACLSTNRSDSSPPEFNGKSVLQKFKAALDSRSNKSASQTTVQAAEIKDTIALLKTASDSATARINSGTTIGNNNGSLVDRQHRKTHGLPSSAAILTTADHAIRNRRSSETLGNYGPGGYLSDSSTSSHEATGGRTRRDSNCSQSQSSFVQRLRLNEITPISPLRGHANISPVRRVSAKKRRSEDTDGELAGKRRTRVTRPCPKRIRCLTSNSESSLNEDLADECALPDDSKTSLAMDSHSLSPPLGSSFLISCAKPLEVANPKNPPTQNCFAAATANGSLFLATVSLPKPSPTSEEMQTIGGDHPGLCADLVSSRRDSVDMDISEDSDDSDEEYGDKALLLIDEEEAGSDTSKAIGNSTPGGRRQDGSELAVTIKSEALQSADRTGASADADTLSSVQVEDRIPSKPDGMHNIARTSPSFYTERPPTAIAETGARNIVSDLPQGPHLDVKRSLTANFSSASPTKGRKSSMAPCPIISTATGSQPSCCCSWNSLSLSSVNKHSVRSAKSHVSNMLKLTMVATSPVKVYQSLIGCETKISVEALAIAIKESLLDHATDMLKSLYDPSVTHKPPVIPHVGITDKKLWELLEYLVSESEWKSLVQRLRDCILQAIVSQSGVTGYNQQQEASLCRFYAYLCEKLNQPQLIISLMHNLFLMRRKEILHLLVTLAGVTPNVFKAFLKANDSHSTSPLLRDIIRSLIVQRKIGIRRKICQAFTVLCHWDCSDSAPEFTPYFERALLEMQSCSGEDDLVVATTSELVITDHALVWLDTLKLIILYADVEFVFRSVLLDILFPKLSRWFQDVLIGESSSDDYYALLLGLAVYGILAVWEALPKGNSATDARIQVLQRHADRLILECQNIITGEQGRDVSLSVRYMTMMALMDMSPLFPRRITSYFLSDLLHGLTLPECIRFRIQALEDIYKESGKA